MPFPALLAPGRIGAMELRNRIVMSPMGDNQATVEGCVSDQQAAYFEARARGGAALIVMGSVGVSLPVGGLSPFQAGVAEDRHIPSLADLATRVHRHGAKLAVQLSHGGKVAGQATAAGVEALVPSAVAIDTTDPTAGAVDPLMGMLTPEEARGTAWSMQTGHRPRFRAMTVADIEEVVAQYAAGAARAQAAGLDGVELHAGHGYLVDQFLSPTTNHRTDAYGGSVANRVRFLDEVLRAIRRAVGPDFALWCRLNGKEFAANGETLDDGLAAAATAAAAGVDALNVSAYADPGLAAGYTEAHTTHTPGRFLAFAGSMKGHTGLPVIAVGRIEPAVADQAIADGTADFVAMGRKLLADPELPNKLRAARVDDIRPCIYHYRCISQIFVGEGVRCAANPETGREGAVAHADGSRSPGARDTGGARPGARVVVVGAGPAGLEAARLAAGRGFRVHLLEAGGAAGGQLRTAAATYGPHADLLRWLWRQVTAAGVDVTTDHRATVADLRAAGADALIVATGSRARRDLPGARLAHVVGLEEWDPERRPPAGARVVIVGGDRGALAVAEYLEGNGAQVTVLEASDVFARQSGLPGRWRFVTDARARGITLIPGAEVLGVTATDVTWRGTEGTTVTAPAELVVITEAMVPDRTLADGAAEAGAAVSLIGDAAEPRGIEGALRSAADAVARIGSPTSLPRGAAR